MSDDPILLDSITDVTAAATGCVVVSGSHGGLFPATVASDAGMRAVVFNDAGIGLDQAGVAGVMALGNVEMAAAGVNCFSCNIGSAEDMIARGVISVVNLFTEKLGVEVGMSVKQAVELMASAMVSAKRLPMIQESRRTICLNEAGPIVNLVDSASLIGSIDVGKIVVTGSHGGLIGANPDRAIKALARVAVFNDAGFGLGDIGVSRLPALETHGVAAVTVSCESARIGDAKSTLESGVISQANALAVAMGAKRNQSLSEWLATLEN